MIIRRLNKNDYEQFLVLINQFRETDFTEKDFILTLDKIEKNSEIWIMENEDKVIASATIIFEYKFIFDISCLAHIEDVIVDINYRRKGYGKILINHLKKIAKSNNCYRLTLDCNDTNVNFYNACDFEKRGNQMCFLL